MNAVQTCWLRQSRTEYTAAALTSELCHWLLQIGERPDLLVRCTRVVEDEVRHAAMCHELFLYVGGEPQPVAVDPRHLRHADDPDAPMPWRAFTAACELACEESVALPVFRLRARNATDPRAAEVVAQILRDEATHRAFAWDLVDSLRERLGPDSAEWVRARVGWWLRVYLRARLEEQVTSYGATTLGFGLIDRREHWQAMKDCVQDTVLPRFVERGLLPQSISPEQLVEELCSQEQAPGP